MRRSPPRLPSLALLLLVGHVATARAEIDTRLSLSSMLYGESQALPAADSDASPNVLAYGDLRVTLAGRRLAHGLSFKLDGRLRLTGDFTQADALLGKTQVTARGYDGGREYELREAWGAYAGDRFGITVGRQWIVEADALKLDGARARLAVGAPLADTGRPPWEAALFAGLYPNPFSRSVVDDYTSQLAVAGGGSLAWSYPRLWGSLAAVGTYLGGPDDGGSIPATGDPANSPPAAMRPRTEAARIYLAGTLLWRPLDWLSAYGDLVVDVAGAAGAQLTRADLTVEARPFAQPGTRGSLLGDRLVLAAGYSHLSSLAIEMYLLQLLADRRTYLPGTIENNLVVARTGRDEGRLRADVRAVSRLHLYGDARVRQRDLDGTDDPSFAHVGALTAYDVTVGVRDLGDLAGVRVGLSLSEIVELRGETQLVELDLGRDFLDERLAIDASILVEQLRDAGVGAPCTMPGASTAGTPNAAQPPPGLATGCFGQRSGAVGEGALTASLRLDRRWFFLLDWRLVVDTATASAAPASRPPLLTHVGFARIELRL